MSCRTVGFRVEGVARSSIARLHKFRGFRAFGSSTPRSGRVLESTSHAQKQSSPIAINVLGVTSSVAFSAT